jgi:tetratricopeptide (TPR) repeat protein
MSYPGNASLSSAVKDRVLSTFRQALVLYHEGRTEEVTAGCTLILQMDPTFDPARKMIEKIKNPALPIDVDTLLPQDPRTAIQAAREAMADRDFERVIHTTTEILTNDLLNDEARVLGDEAREKLEAAPFVEQFARKCDQHLASGNVAAAKMDLEKARAIDATHPEVIRIAKAIEARGSAPAVPVISPSFVIDPPVAPAGGSRPAAQAAEFGFSFEEEKPAEASFANFSFDAPTEKKEDAPFGGFSFGTPEPAAPASAPGEFDFATAAIVTNDEDQKKIEQYLVDGDRAFEGGDYQQAIDLWSRIFLIDVTNDDASDRIERAKLKRRELEKKVEPLVASGIAAFERGDTARAHTDLNEALRIDPQNSTAQEYLDRLGETVSNTPAAISNAYVPPSSGSDSFYDDALTSEDSLRPPDPVAAPVARPASGKRDAVKTKTSPPGTRKLPMGLIAAVVGVIVLGLGGWFIWSKSSSKPEVEQGASQGIMARAAALGNSGKYDQAIALLQDIKPTDPQHDEAMVMIDELQTKKASSAEMINGVPAQQYYEQQLVIARQAFDAHDYAGAKAALDQAMRVKPLPEDLKGPFEQATQQVAKLASAKALFAEQKYSEAIANLQPLLDQDPQNQNVQRMIVDAHFNLGVESLQQERLTDAIREFDQVLAVNPNDELAKRSRDLAGRYDGEKKDLLYQIYVKYLPRRQPV